MPKTIRHLSITVFTSFLVFVAGGVSAYEASRGPTELIYWDPHKAVSGYSLVRTRGPHATGVYLIDMAGQVVNFLPGFRDAYLLEDGTISGTKGTDTFVHTE